MNAITYWGDGINKDEDYHTQRNNKIDPHGTCNTTAIIMAMRKAGVFFNVPKGVQREDHMTQFLQSNEANRIRKLHYPCISNEYQNYEIHGMLEWACNLLVDGRGVAKFSTGWSLGDIVCALQRGAGVVLPGDFPHYKYGTIGHLVSIANVSYDNGTLESARDFDLTYLLGFLIDDPYGDFRDGYNPECEGFDKGNDVVLDIFDFQNIKRGKAGECWAHIISKV